MGGCEALDRLLEVDPEVKAIASSGYFTDPVMSKPREHGFSGVLQKPYSLAKLSETLREVLAPE